MYIHMHVNPQDLEVQVVMKSSNNPAPSAFSHRPLGEPPWVRFQLPLIGGASGQPGLCRNYRQRPPPCNGHQGHPGHEICYHMSLT